MDLTRLAVGFCAILSLAEAISLPVQSRILGRDNKDILRRQQHGHTTPIKMPAWNYANATTPDATKDGLVGVIIEPDLDMKKPAKDGAQYKKIKVGPLKVEGGKAKLFALNRAKMAGITSSIVGATMVGVGDVTMDTPCKDCYITAMQLGLEYPDGAVANVNTGAWCHHIDLGINTGDDYTCPTTLAGFLTASLPSMGNRRIFSGGNERVPVRLNSKGKYGVDLNPGNRVANPVFGGVLEIMNERKDPLEVYMTMIFEYVPKSTPGYKRSELIWVDVQNCTRQSEFRTFDGIKEKKSQSWTVKEDGDLLTGIGHVHDGGTKVDLYVNNKLSCSSKQIYANRRGGYTEPQDGTIVPHMVMPAGSHISDVGVCKDWTSVKKGDKVRIVAYYDDTQHMQMRNGAGKLEEQMGIMFTYIGIK